MQSTLYASKHPNVGPLERLLSIAGGVIVLRRAMRGKGPLFPSMLAGGYLVYRGSTGRCVVYRSMGIERAGRFGKGGIMVERAVTIDRPIEEVYNEWRNFTNLPRFMESLESVTMEAGGKSRWVAKPVKGLRLEWLAETVADEPNNRISWRSVSNSQVKTSGTVRFLPAPGGRGTELLVHMTFDPPGESMSAAIAKVFGRDPQRQLREDLRRFKRMLETGEVPSTEGQPHGPGKPTSMSEKQKMQVPALEPKPARAMRAGKAQEVRP